MGMLFKVFSKKSYASLGLFFANIAVDNEDLGQLLGTP